MQTPGHQCPCFVCTNIATPYDVVDFNKSCEENQGIFEKLSLVPVYYYRCTQCGFVFAPEIAQWTPEQFKEFIYNEDYARFDPDFAQARPNANAEMLNKAFAGVREQITILDYGGGNGLMAQKLQQMGFTAESYDPFYDAEKPASGQLYDLVSAFEVFEHTPFPLEMMNEILGYLKDNGILLFSTLKSDENIYPHGRLTWWYASPRNGHISIFSETSLRVLGKIYGLNFHSFSPGVHMYYRTLPEWAKQAFKIS